MKKKKKKSLPSPKRKLTAKKKLATKKKVGIRKSGEKKEKSGFVLVNKERFLYYMKRFAEL